MNRKVGFSPPNPSAVYFTRGGLKPTLLLFAAAMLAILVLAAAFRLPRLAQRPMHADEANQAVKTGRLYETGKYEYDTTDHHGPSLYCLTLPSLWVSGARDLASSQEVAYRIVPVIFGLGLIPLLLLVADGLGRPAVLAAALLTAISPAFVFYSRYYIQETLLVFFTLAARIRLAIPAHRTFGLDSCRRSRSRHDARHERDVDPLRSRGCRRRRIGLGLG